ncbi:MAG: asparaginase [Gemella sp.]|nr:asparaginase [Gemella sp.]
MTKKLLLINTGGTISMSEDRRTGKVSPSSENPINQTDSIFSYIADVKAEELYHMPSPHVTTTEMDGLRKRVEKAEKEGYDGVVVTHGTDTLEETAYFLDLTLDVSIPVVITGAMRSSNEIGSDGLANLRSSLLVAASEEAKEHGVLVVMNDEVHAAAYVTKTHTTNVATFQTPTFGPVALVSKSDVIFFQKFLRKETYKINSLDKKVHLLKAYAGMDGELIDAVRELGSNGLVIEALGSGNLPPATEPAIKRCIEAGIPVAFVSRAFNGVTRDVYDYAGGGKRFKQEGVIFTTGLSGQKARLKLFVLLNSGFKAEELASKFEI